jgi:uncharacterized protein (DUF1697 family)
MNYVALLRGINVGGNAMIRMSELKACRDVIGNKNPNVEIRRPKQIRILR